METKEKPDINFKRNLKMYWEIAGKYKIHIVGILFMILLVTVARVADKFIFKVLIDEGTNFANGVLSASAFVHILIVLVLVFFSLLVAKVIGQWFKLHINNRMASKMIYDLKVKFFNHLIDLDHEFHTTHKTGSLISRLARGSWALDGLNDFFVFNGVPVIIQFCVAGASVFYFDRLSALVVVVMSVLFVVYSLYIFNKQKTYKVLANDAEDLEKANIGDVFTNVDSVKYYGKEDRVKGIFSKLAMDTSRKYKKNWDYFRWFDAGQSLIIGVGLFFLIYFPIVRFLNGEISIGTLAFMYAVFGSLSEPLFSFVWGVRRYYEAMANLEALFDYSKYKNRIEDKLNAPLMKVRDGSVEFRNVDFCYHKNRGNAVDGVNLKINPNEKIALVGHSGCGKTTLIKLLYRFYDPQFGELLIDGKNINEFKQESLRSELSIVPQEAILFDDTIYNNILFSNPRAKRADVLKAMQFAQLDKFVAKLPDKEKTIVGERGVKLSGGEKQRVSIARAILANKKILVLDEATSALDSKTEYEIQKDLDKLMKGRTSIIIAHRLSTIMHADKIVVLDDGKIVQVGKHNELIKQKGIYRELWNLQKGGYIKE